MTHKSMSDPKVLKAPVGVLGKDLRDPGVTKLCSTSTVDGVNFCDGPECVYIDQKKVVHQQQVICLI